MGIVRRLREAVPLPLIHATSLEQRVRGDRILITGASSGIGRASAVRLGAAGARLILVARRESELADVAAQVFERGGRAHVHACDLTDFDALEAMASEVIAEHGGVDVLVNNAGRSIRRSIDRSYDRPHDFERTIELNYLAAVRLVLAFLPGMRERGHGHIVNISSMGTQIATPRFSAYIASKMALEGFSRAIATEIMGDGVHVTNVHMPLVRTPMIEPTDVYRTFPSISPDHAAGIVAKAIRDRPKRVSSLAGDALEISNTLAPGLRDSLVHRGYRAIPEDADEARERGEPSAAQRVAARLIRLGGRR